MTIASKAVSFPWVN